MNNKQPIKEYSEEDFEKFLKQKFDAVVPSESLLQLTLDKLPDNSLPSPYRWSSKIMSVSLKRISLSIAALIIVVGGVGVIFHAYSSQQNTPGVFGDQLSAIDMQMNGLDSDSAMIDQSLNHEKFSY